MRFCTHAPTYAVPPPWHQAARGALADAAVADVDHHLSQGSRGGTRSGHGDRTFGSAPRIGAAAAAATSAAAHEHIGLMFKVPGGVGTAGAAVVGESGVDDRVSWVTYRRKVTEAVVISSPTMQRAASLSRGPSIYFRGARLKVDFTTGSMQGV